MGLLSTNLVLLCAGLMMTSCAGQYQAPYYYYRPAPSFYYYPHLASPMSYNPHFRNGAGQSNPYYYFLPGQQRYPFDYFRSGANNKAEEPDRQPETFYVPAVVNGAFGTTLSIQNKPDSEPNYFNFIGYNPPSSSSSPSPPSSTSDGSSSSNCESNKEALAAAFRSYQPPGSDYYYNKPIPSYPNYNYNNPYTSPYYYY